MAARPADFHKGKALVCPEEEHAILKLHYSIRQAFYVSHLPRSTSTTNQGRAPEENDYARRIQPLYNSTWQKQWKPSSPKHLILWLLTKASFTSFMQFGKSLHLRLVLHKRPIQGRDETSEHVKYLGAIAHAGLYKWRAGFGHPHM